MLFTMASVGLPGTSGFVGEFLALAGAYQVSTWATLICTTGIIFGAGYMLYLYRRVAFGDQKNADAAAMTDIDGRELWLLAPIAAAVLWMGVYPESFLHPIRADVAKIVVRIERAAPKSDSVLKANDPTMKGYRVKETAHHGEAKAEKGSAH
jgi:NADH-quinone oxidoreductase subunit M